jgi:hypothetical protein
MSRNPDFYLYQGESGTDVLDVVRSCWKLEIINLSGKEITVVRIDPDFPVGPLFTEPKTDVIGLASRSTWFKVGEFGGSYVVGAVAWKIERGAGTPCKAITSIGLVTLWKDRPD